MPEAVPRVPDRRREDPLLRQMLELLEATRATVASMNGRLTVIEREIGRVREVREALRIDDMSLEQKRSFIELADWWVDRREDSESAAERLRRAAAVGTVLQAVIAATLAVLTLYTVLHHSG